MIEYALMAGFLALAVMAFAPWLQWSLFLVGSKILNVLASVK